jgi:hypothetical protein
MHRGGLLAQGSLARGAFPVTPVAYAANLPFTVAGAALASLQLPCPGAWAP